MTARKVAIGMRILCGGAVVALAVMALMAAALPPPVNFVFSQDPKVGTEPYSSAVGDFNRDGIPDIAVTNYASDSVSLLFGRGTAHSSPPSQYLPALSPPELLPAISMAIKSSISSFAMRALRRFWYT